MNKKIYLLNTISQLRYCWFSNTLCKELPKDYPALRKLIGEMLCVTRSNCVIIGWLNASS